MLRWRQFFLAAAGLFGRWCGEVFEVRFFFASGQAAYRRLRQFALTGCIALAASCGSMVTHQWNRRANSMPDTAQPRFRPLCGPSSGWGHKLGMQMYSIDCARNAKSSCVATEENSIPDASPVPGARVWKIFRLLVIVLGAASLAACAQSSVVRHSASLQRDRTASFFTPLFFTSSRFASVKKHTPFARPSNATPTQIASQGVASFYTEGQQTASGEKFDTHDLTAAHPTLPFGTRLRVTNVGTGRSVIVRVNDRGPYVPGRVVDVSHSAANALGMVQSGIAKVKLDVIQ